MDLGSDPLGPVSIGAREIYDEVRATRSAVERLTDRHSEIVRRVDDHETRIRTQERARWPLPSLATLVGLAALVLAAVPLIR